MVATSAVLLIPCFWQKWIEAGDLPSHLYNAWLAELISQGKAPGLWIAHQWTNVLFDSALALLFRGAGPWWAEHIAVALSVLVFFWGAFAFLSAVNRRAPWPVVPCLAMLAYGYVFHAGFFNYYISLGISLFLCAIAWRGRRADGFVFAGGLIVAFLAHPVPVLWALASTAYVHLARQLPQRPRWFLFPAAIACVIAARAILVHRFTTIWTWGQLLDMTGADQVAVFGRTGWCLAGAVVVVWCLAVFRGNPEWGAVLRGIPAQLFYIAAAIIALLPDTILISPERPGWFSAGAPRMSLLAGVLACSIVALRPLRRWHAWAFSILAALFFTMFYANHRELSRLEAEMSSLVQQLPPDQRVISYFSWQASGERDPHFVYRLETAFERAVADLQFGVRFLGAVQRARIRWAAWHLLDRACIGRCFSYGNYEPYIGQFRVRASPGNRIVVADGREAEAMERGTYVVKPADLPIFEIYRCAALRVELCIRPLRAGELNGGPPAAFRPAVAPPE